MYSVVLMAALTTGGNAPDCGLFRCWCRAHYSCAGCWGYAGCYTCAGCWGSCYGGCYGTAYVTHGCYGCMGCYGCEGAAFVPVVPASPPRGPMAPAPAPRTEKKEKETFRQDKAKLLVEVPADAKLYIDDRLMKATAAVRSFNTPVLEEGQPYYYILRAEVMRDGKTYEETKRVIVWAGEEVRTTFPDLEAAVTLAAKK